MIRAAVTAPLAAAEELRARFVELAPEGFEESERRDGTVELAAYGDAAARILEAFPAASAAEVADGWEDRWREFHHGSRIGVLWVGPPWEAPPGDAVAVTIDPGRAFGTGGHPTTRLCLELLLEESRTSLLDVGCGSGVIAIAAARLGFAPVLAIDADPAAVEATVRNARANGVHGAVEARRHDALAGPLPAAGLAVANIALETVEALGPRLASGRAITSGYLASDRPELESFAPVGRRELDGWAADVFERV